MDETRTSFWFFTNLDTWRRQLLQINVARWRRTRKDFTQISIQGRSGDSFYFSMIDTSCRNLKLYVESYMKRTDILEEIRTKLK